ncbi:MAG: hypothetical protein CME04_24110 [Gemmatimonadaceae bacterium]|nr:hypothetical protein [Gemmatimonadaceae bacterium]
MGAVSAGVVAGSAVLFLVLIDSVILPAIVEVPMVTVRDVRGQSTAAARQRISAIGLRLAVRDSVYSETAEAGQIVDQAPEPGQRIKRARRVFVDVSRGRRLYLVPDVAGGSLREAGLQIQGHQLAMGNVRPVSHTSVPEGVVIRQDPVADTRVPRRTRIDLQISSGSPFAPKAVPHLLGLSISVVEDSLLKYEMTLGKVTDRVAELLPPGQVLSQSPEAGVGVQRHTAVDLVVSVRRETTPDGE